MHSAAEGLLPMGISQGRDREHADPHVPLHLLVVSVSVALFSSSGRMAQGETWLACCRALSWLSSLTSSSLLPCSAPPTFSNQDTSGRIPGEDKVLRILFDINPTAVFFRRQYPAHTVSSAHRYFEANLLYLDTSLQPHNCAVKETKNGKIRMGFF